jgi:hypothetical protein
MKSYGQNQRQHEIPAKWTAGKPPGLRPLVGLSSEPVPGKIWPMAGDGCRQFWLEFTKTTCCLEFYPYPHSIFQLLQSVRFVTKLPAQKFPWKKANIFVYRHNTTTELCKSTSFTDVTPPMNINIFHIFWWEYSTAVIRVQLPGFC